MSRHPITIRDADREDAAALIALWKASAEASPAAESEAVAALTVPGAAEAIDQAISRPDTRLFVALIGGEIVGAALCEVRNASPLSLQKVLAVTNFQVAPQHRRKGVAGAMLSAASTFAEEHDVAVMLAAVKAQFRETHRYLTKLGFSQSAVVRAAPAEALRSRLAVKTAGDTGRLVATRRVMQRRRQSNASTSL